MRAVQMEQTGGPEVLRLTEVPDLRPGPGEARLRVEAAGVNFADTRMRGGTYPLLEPLPTVLGYEAAGTVDAVGEGVDAALVGARVLALLGNGGGYAEQVLADTSELVLLPEGLEAERAVAVAVQGLTAYFLVEATTQPTPGDVALVHAAAGGVGGLLVQLLKRRGVRTVVAAAGGEAKVAAALGLGADLGVDYLDPSWTDRALELTGGSGADVVYAAAGGSTTVDSLSVLAPFGRMAVFGALDAEASGFEPRHVTGMIYNNQALMGMSVQGHLARPGATAGAIAALLEGAISGSLRVPVHPPYALERASDAHRDGRAQDHRQGRTRAVTAQMCPREPRLGSRPRAVLTHRFQSPPLSLV